MRNPRNRAQKTIRNETGRTAVTPVLVRRRVSHINRRHTVGSDRGLSVDWCSLPATVSGVRHAMQGVESCLMRFNEFTIDNEFMNTT